MALLATVQAQRCFDEKLLAERSPSQPVLSCLAAAAAQLYAEAAGAIEHAHGAPFTRLGGGEWTAAVAAHASLYGALARLHAAAAHAARGEHGERLGQLDSAQQVGDIGEIYGRYTGDIREM